MFLFDVPFQAIVVMALTICLFAIERLLRDLDNRIKSIENKLSDSEKPKKSIKCESSKKGTNESM